MGRALDNDNIGLPAPKPVGQKTLPHVILADDAFSLKPNLMKPFPGKYLEKENRIFNYRLSRGRMVVENAFGVLAARWRIFHTAIIAELDLAKLIVHTAVILHNFLIVKQDTCNITLDGEQGQRGNWRETVEDDSGLEDLAAQGSNNFSFAASEVRKDFCQYFNNEGAVSWQNNSI
jgi:hypothetical protein